MISAPPVVPAPRYTNILVSLDHSDADGEAVSNALAIAQMYGARITLMHVEEGVTSQLFGSLSSTTEINEGQQYLAKIVESLRQHSIRVDTVVRHGTHPAAEITAVVEQLQPDLLVMASHGHRGLKDIIFGTTINNVRHRIRIPMMIVNRTQPLT